MAWNSIIGQQRVQSVLRALVENSRLPHAMLFYGPDGTGKEAVAIELARTLNCDRGTWDACGVCPSCRKMQIMQHERLKLVFAMPSKDDENSAVDKLTPAEIEEMNAQIALKARDPYHHISMNKAGGIKISSIRDIRKESAMRASGQGRTVVVICEAERMNNSAANALLKTLEEPGGDLLLILTTSRRDALLPTIRSRCQQLRFDPIPEITIREALERDPDIPRENIGLAAHLANGSYSEAVQIASSDGLVKREDIVDYMRAVMTANPQRIMEEIQDRTASNDRQTVIRFLNAVSTWFRDILVLQAGAESQVRNVDLMVPLSRFNEHYPDVKCAEAIEIIEDVIELIQKNVHLVNVLVVLSLRLRHCIVPSEQISA